jgi:hypothetical protein
MRWDDGCSLSSRNVRMEGQIFRVVEREPEARTRYLAAPTDTSYPSVNRTLQGNQFYPYYIQLVARDLLNFHRTH